MKEIEREAGRLQGEPVHTIYFGGGTPSLLTVAPPHPSGGTRRVVPDGWHPTGESNPTGKLNPTGESNPTGELNQLMEALHRHFKIAPDAEITLEANPDDINASILAGWRSAGINRLSIGVQSFREQDLRWMNRAHTASEAELAIRLATEAGFSNITIDLIYGTPGLTDEAWQENLQKALELKVTHLSCYALTVEPKTALDHMVRTAKMPDTDPEQQRRQFLLLMDQMEKAGFEHYEISNFALPGKRSRHNSAYWRGIPYLGIGPGAHSFDGSRRRWNVANNALYTRTFLGTQASDNPPIYEEEILTTENRFNEYVMTALRTMEGIDLNLVRSTYGEKQTQVLLQTALRHNQPDQHIIISDNFLRLTNAGKLFADGIAADFFIGV